MGPMQSETLCVCVSTCIACTCSRRHSQHEAANASVSVLAVASQYLKLHQHQKSYVWHSLQMCCSASTKHHYKVADEHTLSMVYIAGGHCMLLWHRLDCSTVRTTHQSFWSHQPTVCKKAWKAVTASASVAKPPVSPTSTRSHANH